jgi:hypothetical protein
MFCHHCGARLGEGHVFCAACGAQVSFAPTVAAPPASVPAVSRFETHRTLLAMLWMAAGVLKLMSAFSMFLFSRLDFFRLNIPFISDFGLPEFFFGLSVFMIPFAIATFVAGYGLLDRQPWARPLAIVLSILKLFNVPFGTALGIYTLWVLLPGEPNSSTRRATQTA